ncbi:hypothetical protein B0T09DRAFT_339684 [Sordaria sp. MPI-SDFR-AT-0083]|nr:hypothetical protein B0T09DRAFT_339684 [Sordaria sp. MPI-SDFR-AT-0083]
MPSLTRRSSDSCPPDPARYPRSERNTRQDDAKSHRSDRRQSSPALTHRRRKSRRSTSITSDDNRSRISTIDEDHKDDPESDYYPRDVYYLSHPPGSNHGKDEEEKSEWDLDLEAGAATPMNHRNGYGDDDAHSTRSRGRIPRPSTIVRRPSTIGTLSPRTRSPIDQSRRQSMRPDNLYVYGSDHHRRDSVRSRPRREPHHHVVSDSETAVFPRTRRHRQHVNRSPTPPHRGLVAYDHSHEYPRPRPRSSTQPFHYPNYTDDDEREDTYHRNNNNNSNNPRRYHRRRAYSNPPIPSRHPHRTQSRRRPSLSSTLNFTKDLKDLKYSPKAASLLKAASRALEAGAATALKLRKDSPSTPLFSAASGSKIAAAALGAAVVDGLMEHEHQRHPKLMRKGGLRHQMVKQVVQRGVAGLVGGMIEEGLTGGGGGDCGGDRGKEEEGKKGRRPGKKESVKRVVKGAVMDYEKWEKGKGGDDGGGNGSGKEEKGGRGRRGSERERERERERDTDGEGRRRERKRERERERGREGSVRSRRR